jgi:hypothetical protein
LVSQIRLKQNTPRRMVVSRQFDYLDRLLQVSSAPEGANQLPWVRGYGLNAGNQRTRLTLGDSGRRRVGGIRDRELEIGNCRSRRDSGGREAAYWPASWVK